MGIKEPNGVASQHLCHINRSYQQEQPFLQRKLSCICMYVFSFFLGMEVLHFNAWFWHLVQKNNWDANSQISLHPISENSSLCLSFLQLSYIHSAWGQLFKMRTFIAPLYFSFCRRELRHKFHPCLTAHKVCLYVTKINSLGFLQPGFCSRRYNTCQCRLPAGKAQERTQQRQVGGLCRSWWKDGRKGTLPFPPTTYSSAPPRPRMRHSRWYYGQDWPLWKR